MTSSGPLIGAGLSGIAAGFVVGVGVPPLPLPGAQAATSSATATSARAGASRTPRVRSRRSVTGTSSADRVVAAGMPGVASGDPLGTHPAAAEQAVLLDRLLGVARAGRLVAAAL